MFIWSPDEEGATRPGAATCWWLHQSLKSLGTSLERIGSRLILQSGPALPALRSLAKETGASAVFWNRRYEPDAIALDKSVDAGLRKAGLETATFNAALLFEPHEIVNQQGKPFQVFTAYWRPCCQRPAPPEPEPTPRKLHAPATWPRSRPLDDLALEPRINWTDGMHAAWEPGEAGAQRQFAKFLESSLMDYPTDRDRPDRTGTSRLSPHLHFGEISPRQVWHAVQEARAQAARKSPKITASADCYLREIGWREFAHHLLFHFPHTLNQPLRPQYARFPWNNSAANLKAWQRGQTGYPIVDAGMRELWTTGWMHNRVRMIVGSFLVKDLLIDWREGAAWFWDTLVDADAANNTLGWQWVGGCGADAAPYFRIFNPVTQSQKFDPEGAYIRRWVPELGKLDNDSIHAPWELPPLMLQAAGVTLGKSYPSPIVDHKIAREKALAALREVTQPAQ